MVGRRVCERAISVAGSGCQPDPALRERPIYSGRGVTVAEAVVIDASDFTVM
jgi:hypothetical protein